MRGLALRLLGPPQVTLDGSALSFDTRKAVALLAFLACTRRPHTREALATLLWPEYADARNALRRTLSTLQHALGPGWLEAGREQIRLLNRPDLWLDVAAFEAQSGPAADSEALAAALALYHDDFLAGFIDRRFFRKKYDAALVLAEFAARAQRESDLGAVSADLLATVRETLEPESASLWLVRRS